MTSPAIGGDSGGWLTLEYILLLIIVAVITFWVYKSYQTIHWHNKEPLDCLYKVIQNYGEPSILNKKYGGMAVWNILDLKGTIFNKIEIKDEVVYQTQPFEHQGFIYVYIPLLLDLDNYHNIQRNIPNISYDFEKEELCIRSGNMEASIITLKLISEILVHKIDMKDILNKLKSEFKYINSSRHLSLFYKEIIQNIQIYYKSLKSVNQKQVSNEKDSNNINSSYPPIKEVENFKENNINSITETTKEMNKNNDNNDDKNDNENNDEDEFSTSINDL